MPRWSFHYSLSRLEPFPPLDRPPLVEAETALAAAHVALAQFPPMLTAPEIWCPVVLTLHADGSVRHVLSVPLTAERQIPLDWTPPTVGPQ